MKKLNSYKLIILLIMAMGVFSSCEKWVNDVDPLISSAEGSNLISEEQLKIQLVGLLSQANTTQEWEGFGHMMYRTTLWSDEVQFEYGVPGTGAADHLAFAQDTKFDLDFVEGDWQNYQQLRWLADRLVQVTNQIDSEVGFDNNSLKEECLWWGNVIGGMMRAMLGEHWCLTQGGAPGAVITTIEQFEAGEFGSFMTMQELHTLARAKYTEALKYNPGGTDGLDEGTSDKVVQSLMARTYLFDGNYAAAASAAEQGLEEGDTPFHFISSYQYFNSLWAAYSRGYNTVGDFNVGSIHPRFLDYVLNDRTEGEIISNIASADEDPDGLSLSLRDYEGDDGEAGNKYTEEPRSGMDNPNERLPIWESGIQREGDAYTDVTYTFDIYQNRDDNVNIIDWREMQLILAEVELRTGSDAQALVHFNNVRSAHGLADLTQADLNNYDNEKGGANNAYWPGELDHNHIIGSPNAVTGKMGLLIEERDKTLMYKGLRVVDQYRFNLWHLESDSWQLYPIPYSERIQNPNISMDL
jgi:starch-binding outer membrane protein, SusD/RagB family